ncbi:MAG TPA: aminopeptidase P N-terminal domain-containing protein [Burkholderiaceae bacterium]
MSPYFERRARLIAQMQAMGGGVAVIPTALEAMRNSDTDYPYRHDSRFYYLSGFTEPEAVLVLIADAQPTCVLFCRDKDVEREIWDGYRHGPQGAKETFGFDAAFSIAKLDEEMAEILSDAPALFYGIGRDAELEARVQSWLGAVRAKERSGVRAPTQFHDVLPLIDEMRLFKDEAEVALMRRAAEISSGAHARAMRVSRPGMRVYEIEAELLHEFRRHGSPAPAYNSIVAAGANACVLHYPAGSSEAREGELILIDAGCEFGSYASDITRTYPVNGKFSAAQKRLYEIVLAAQDAAIAAVKPGMRFIDPHNAALDVLVQGMLDTGLLDKAKYASAAAAIASNDYRRFYMHRTSHWLGMDVHDVGDYHEANEKNAAGAKPWRVLRPGMVLTIEPGLYVRPAEDVPEEYWNIGIRIEDDVLVTEDGCEVLTRAAPKTVAEIESLMQSR